MRPVGTRHERSLKRGHLSANRLRPDIAREESRAPESIPIEASEKEAPEGNNQTQLAHLRLSSPKEDATASPGS